MMRTIPIRSRRGNPTNLATVINVKRFELETILKTLNCHRGHAVRRAYIVRLSTIFVLLFVGLPSTRSEQNISVKEVQTNPLTRPPRDWAVDAATNEKEAIHLSGLYVRYRVHIVGAKGDQVRDVLESKDGTVARLIYKENRPLTQEEDAAEHERLQTMIDSPSAFTRHIKGDRSGKKFASDLVALMPDAMTYTYAPGQPQRDTNAGKAGVPSEIVLDFEPNPNWNPPTMTSQALLGLKGRIWVDARTHHVGRLDGIIFRTISLGFGIVVRVAPGGQFSFEQVPITDQRWIFSHFSEHLTLRALLVKTMKENSEINASKITRVEPMDYKEAIRTLLATPLPRTL